MLSIKSSSFTSTTPHLRSRCSDGSKKRMMQDVPLALAYSMNLTRLKSRTLSPAMTSMSSSSPRESIANWMSRTAPRRVSFVEVPSSTTVILSSGRPAAHSTKCPANLWLEMTAYSSTAPEVLMSSISQSRMALSRTLSSGFGKFRQRVEPRGITRGKYQAFHIFTPSALWQMHAE